MTILHKTAVKLFYLISLKSVDLVVVTYTTRHSQSDFLQVPMVIHHKARQNVYYRIVMCVIPVLFNIRSWSRTSGRASLG